MTTLATLPANSLEGLNVQTGDVLHIVGRQESSFLVEITKPNTAEKTAYGNARAWLKTARGTVRQVGDQPADDLRMDYYAAKYGIHS